MIVPVFSPRQLLVKTGIGRHINLTADNRLNPRFPRRLIKINNAVHHAVVRYGSTVHAQLLDTLDIFFYFVGAV